MRYLLCVSLTLCGLSTLAARAQDAGSEPAANGAAQVEAGAQAPAQPTATSDTWRYRRHDGLWWYWLPSEKWVYWNDGRWDPYDPQSYAAFKASRAPRVQQNSGYARGGQSGWGPWGPIRYDRYGNPQYPYSQRRSGMQQLGPVPTPAGVRSLPGWGGER